MQDKLYILSIGEFLEESGEAYIQRASHFVDEVRKAKAERIRQPKAKAACLGAGLLLQLALQEALDGADWQGESSQTEGLCTEEDTGNTSLKRYVMSEVFSCLKEPVPLEVSKGVHGKPYLENYPFYFNLSHSGEYVICALSHQEVGVDIQQHRNDDVLKLAERFFSERECEVLGACRKEERQSLFFSLWAKKEAYGKLTGEGVSGVLGLDLESVMSEIDFEEYHDIPGYSIVLCRERRRKV